jgi:hypothetical protein
MWAEVFERMRRARAFRLVLAEALIALSVTGCDQDGDDGEQEARSPAAQAEAPSFCPAARPPAVPTRPGIIVLDDAGRLTRFSVPGADALRTRRLRPTPELPGVAGARLGLPGRYLARAPSGAEIVVLKRDVPPARDALTILDARTLRPRCHFPLPRGNRYRAVATTGDRLIALGNRPAGEGRNAALYTVIDPAGGPPQTRVVRPPSNDWFVQAGAVAENGRDLILSYHGSDTSGADLVRLDAPDRKPKGVYTVHGSAEAVGNSFIATTGTDLVRVDAASGATRELDPHAEDVHLMSFAVDERGSSAYISACGHPPSVNRLDLETGELHILPSGGECGDLLGVVAGRYAALAVAPGELFDPEAVRLRQVDLREGGTSKPLGRSAPLSVIVEVDAAAP